MNHTDWVLVTGAAHRLGREIALAFAADKQAFPKWANTPAKERARLMRKICSVAVRRGARSLTLVGLGNAHGSGMKWREDFSRWVRDDAAGSDCR